MVRKIVYLVRHGQYTYDESHKGEGSLTDIGREQAQCAAQRLRSLPISAIHCSTLQRAVETAAIVGAELPSVPLHRSSGLCECIPGMPEDDAEDLIDCTPEELVSGAAQADKAFDRYFKRPRGADRSELLVCHGNIIRYLVCRTLRIPPAAWNRLSSHNCGISEICIFDDGFKKLVSYNDVGHLSEHLLTR